jgi:hypothetical protein
MRTRPKDLGTRFETFVVRAALDKGLMAERLAEGAVNDLGDIRVYAEVEWVLEARDRQQLNIPRALEKAILKSGTLNTALVYRKMVRKNGNQRRTQDGPVIVALTLPRFLELLAESCGEGVG